MTVRRPGPGERVVDVGVGDALAARSLADRGVRYLGLVEPGRLASLRAEADDLGHRFHPLSSPNQSVRNSTDWLLLRSAHAGLLWHARDITLARFVAIQCRPTSSVVDGALAAAAGMAVGQLRARGTVRFGGAWFAVFEFTGPRPGRPRRYMSEVLGVSALIQELEARGLSYVALRWFETLPSIPPGEDLDLLVADEDLDALREVLDEEPGTMPVDLYSVSGLPGSDFAEAAYYQPNLARRILERAVRHSSGCRVPCPEDHLYSLAYHAIYHKGASSGLPAADGTRRPNPEHDYEAALHKLAAAVGVELPDDLEGIERHLADAGWQPSRDALRRMARANSWLADRFFFGPVDAPEPPTPAIFLIRERTLDHVSVDEALGVLKKYGFEIVTVRELDEEARRRCVTEARGGNWGRGPYSLSGGGPVVAVVGLHYGPRPLPQRLRGRYPNLDNENVLTAKLEIRDLVNAGKDSSSLFNPVHSSDNEAEAWEYVDMALPTEAAAIRAFVARRRVEYRTERPLIETLSLGRRSKVEVVESPAGPIVRKTYAPEHLDKLRLELSTIEALTPHVAAMPTLLDKGPNWLELPLYKGQLGSAEARRKGRLIPLPLLRDVLRTLGEINARGFDLIDVKPQNFLLDPDHGLKVIDFEFTHEYVGAAPRLADSYGFSGVPEGYTGGVPVSWSYEGLWKPFTGMPLRVLLSGSAGQQHFYRALYRVRLALRTILLGLGEKREPARDLARRLKRGSEDRGWQRALGRIDRKAARTGAPGRE